MRTNKSPPLRDKGHACSSKHHSSFCTWSPRQPHTIGAVPVPVLDVSLHIHLVGTVPLWGANSNTLPKHPLWRHYRAELGTRVASAPLASTSSSAFWWWRLPASPCSDQTFSPGTSISAGTSSLIWGLVRPLFDWSAWCQPGRYVHLHILCQAVVKIGVRVALAAVAAAKVVATAATRLRKQEPM